MGAKAFAHHDLIVLPEDAGRSRPWRHGALIATNWPTSCSSARSARCRPSPGRTDSTWKRPPARQQWVRAGASGPPPPVVHDLLNGPAHRGPAARQRWSPSSAGAPQRAPAASRRIRQRPRRPLVTSTALTSSPDGAPDDHDRSTRATTTNTAPCQGLLRPPRLDMFGVRRHAQTRRADDVERPQPGQPAGHRHELQPGRRRHSSPRNPATDQPGPRPTRRPPPANCPRPNSPPSRCNWTPNRAGAAARQRPTRIHNASNSRTDPSRRRRTARRVHRYNRSNPRSMKRKAQRTTKQHTNGAGAPGATQPSAAPGAHRTSRPRTDRDRAGPTVRPHSHPAAARTARRSRTGRRPDGFPIGRLVQCQR